MDRWDFTAMQLGFAWAEQLFESVADSEIVRCPRRWPGHFEQARGLVRSMSQMPQEPLERERLARIVQQSAAAFWDTLTQSGVSARQPGP